MPSLRQFPVLLSLGAAIVVGGCRDTLDIENSDFAIINVPTVRTGTNTFGARPSALFFEGRGILLSSSLVARDSCLAQTYPQEIGTGALDYIDAGSSIRVSFPKRSTEGTLTPTTQGNVNSYALTPGTSIAFEPGDTVHIDIDAPESPLGERTITARTAEEFTPNPVGIPSAQDEDMAVTWTPGTTTVPGAAMFLSFRYALTGTTINREIACFFIDDGSAVVPAELLPPFRASSNRVAEATRVRIAIARDGRVVTHVTSSFVAPVTLVSTP
jgi:hypothetical protein